MRRLRGSGWGWARSRAWVYSSWGLAKTSLVGPVSTIRPWRITAIRSATSAITASWWEMKRIATPSSSRRSRKRFRSWAWTETSRALTASSAMIISGPPRGGRGGRGDGEGLALAAGELARLARGDPLAELDAAEQRRDEGVLILRA